LEIKMEKSKKPSRIDMREEGLDIVTVNLPPELIDRIISLLIDGIFPSFSEAIRVFVAEAIFYVYFTGEKPIVDDPAKKKGMKIRTINLPELYLQKIQKMLDLGLIESRSHFIRWSIDYGLVKFELIREYAKGVIDLNAYKPEPKLKDSQVKVGDKIYNIIQLA
jgi:Arc/MetJ-type ribon-helix-helix transcriptional regulator